MKTAPLKQIQTPRGWHHRLGLSEGSNLMPRDTTAEGTGSLGRATAAAFVGTGWHRRTVFAVPDERKSAGLNRGVDDPSEALHIDSAREFCPSSDKPDRIRFGSSREERSQVGDLGPAVALLPYSVR